jgi:hypothetical protein
MNIPKDTNIESTIAAAESYARASNHALVWHLVQQLQQLRAPLHTGAERQAAFDAADALYLHLPRASEAALLDDAAYALIERVADYVENDPIVAEAAAFGAVAVETAIDQQGEHESLDDALYSYQINAFDTLGDVFGALHGDSRYDNAWHAMDRAFRAALVTHGLTFNG